MMDENRIRLRASCNACNESKVRCSQRKPTCTRCERNGTECIYGLSRRTHKDAPPISTTPSQREGKGSRPGRPPRLPSSGDIDSSTSTNSNSANGTTTRFNDSAIPDESAEVLNNNANFLADYMFPMATETESMHHAAQLLDFSSLVTDSTSSSTAMTSGPFSTTAADFTNPKPWVLDPLADATDMGMYWTVNGEGECTCHLGVTELLASMRGGASSNDQRLSLDAQLARMKQCIASSETSMACAHGREDSEPIHIMAVAMLIGYVIDDFKNIASESSPPKSSSLSSSASAVEMATLGNADRGSKAMSGRFATSSGTNTPLGGTMTPRLSWGMLELEDDDEMDLRQRLYMLSFRKLERLLSQLTVYLRDLHNAWASLPDPSRQTAFVIACGYTRLWLEKKASDVKKLLSVPTNDESMDTTFT